MAQAVEHVLGKDEVTGSNPVISSKNPVHDSGRDFYLLPFHSSLFTKYNLVTGFLESKR